MDQPSSEIAGKPQLGRGLDALLDRARAIGDGTDRWMSAELRDRFAARVIAGEDPLGDNYLANRSPEERRSIGATFTPARIVSAMLQLTHSEAGLQCV